MMGALIVIGVLVLFIMVASKSIKLKRKAVKDGQHSEEGDSSVEQEDLETQIKKRMAADKIVQFETNHERAEYDRLKIKAIGISAYREERKFEKQAERNLLGIELEKAGRTNEAIPLYEQNIKENFVGSHPYERLVIIYRSMGRYDDEIRVIEKAIGRFCGSRKEAFFAKRLDKAKALKEKAEKEKRLETK
jgi:tetratricopeptide (TPR) repeat protein